jgi:hypothetical protein
MSAGGKHRPQAAAGAQAGAQAGADSSAAPDMSSVPAETIDLQIADVLHAVRYPANKDRIVDAARDAGASNELLAILDGLPEQDYTGVDDVTRLIGSNYGPGLGL